MVKNKTNDIPSNRNVSVDFIRCVACFGVVSVHFLLNNGFYQRTMDCKRMYCMAFFRQFFMFCVPLFIMLSGYLECNKRPEKKYYKKIIKIIFVYTLISVLCYYLKPVLYQIFKNEFDLQDSDFGDKSFKGLIKGILGFKACNYAWYVEMYLGLFLLIPFFNVLYNNIPSRKEKRILVATLFVLCSIPSIIRGVCRSQDQLFPEWWTKIWPILYYILGSYVKEYNVKISRKKNIVLIIVFVLASGLLCIWKSKGSVWQYGLWSDWSSLFNVLYSYMVFVFLINIRFERIPIWVKKILVRLSNLCFGIYLASNIFDSVFYPLLAKKVPKVTDRFEYYFVIVPLVFVCSTIVSFAINKIYYYLSKGCGILRRNRRVER